MSDKPLSVAVDEPRDAVTREWEVFVRQADSAPLTHVGSVSAPSPAIAREQAERLFDWTATVLWLCPADEVERVQTKSVEYVRQHYGEAKARRVYEHLRANGGDPTGERVADIDYQGNVHLTQFWQHYSLGNVRDRSFGAIWEDESNPLLGALRDRDDRLKGCCRDCTYRDICRGGSRLRALTVEDDLFGPDPQCYLTDEERQTSPPSRPSNGSAD
jgi:rSAM-partnered protein